MVWRAPVGVPDVQARGFLTFVQQGYTGNALADLLIGLPVLTGGAQLDNPQNLRANTISLFANDDWRVARPLTVSLGVRYDYSTPPHDKDDRANLYDPPPARSSRSAPATSRAAATRPTATTSARASASRGASTSCSGGWCAAATASITTRVAGDRRGLYFNPPYFNLGVYFPAPGLPPLTLNDPFPANFPCSFHSRQPRIKRICRRRGSNTGT